MSVLIDTLESKLVFGKKKKFCFFRGGGGGGENLKRALEMYFYFYVDSSYQLCISFLILNLNSMFIKNPTTFTPFSVFSLQCHQCSTLETRNCLDPYSTDSSGDCDDDQYCVKYKTMVWIRDSGYINGKEKSKWDGIINK